MKKVSLFTLAMIPLCAMAQIVVSPELLSFGDVSEAERPVKTIQLINRGDKTVRIEEIVKTCVCAAVRLDEQTIEPGKSIDVELTLNPNIVNGPFYLTFFAKTDDPKQRSITLAFQGTSYPLWRVAPSKDRTVKPDVREVSFLLTPSKEAKKITSSTVTGPAGCVVKLTPQGELLKVDVTLPEKAELGFNRWDIALYAEDKTWQPFTLSIMQERGSRWKAVPHFIKVPVVEKDYTSVIYIKPANLTAVPSDFDPASIVLSPNWDRVTLVPEGKPSYRGIPYRFTIGADMINTWKQPKTFYFTIPNHGSASLYMEKYTIPAKATPKTTPVK